MEEAPVSGVWEDDFAGQEFRDMISSLPRTADLFSAVLRRGITTKEIALIMEMKENTVKQASSGEKRSSGRSCRQREPSGLLHVRNGGSSYMKYSEEDMKEHWDREPRKLHEVIDRSWRRLIRKSRSAESGEVKAAFPEKGA